MSTIEPAILDRLRYELGNIGIAIASTIDSEDMTTILVEGTGNHRRASYDLPHGVLPEAETDELIIAAVQSIKDQIVSDSGTWPE
jgi:hypothetical protein